MGVEDFFKWVYRNPTDKIDWNKFVDPAPAKHPVDLYERWLKQIAWMIGEYKYGMKPSKIIVNNVTTICVFPDGTKITARPDSVDEFDLDVGIAMCIMKYIYGSRSAFKRAVKSAHIQE